MTKLKLYLECLTGTNANRVVSHSYTLGRKG